MSATDRSPLDRTSRRQRQLAELFALCRSGAVGRAIDLAFEHFAQFGADDELVGLFAAAVDSPDVPMRVRRRFAELCDASR